jgi:DNA-binding MarR family transcriptional regulator
MNNDVRSSSSPETGRYRDLQILDELSNNDALTQRDLSKRMGIALGLVNSYLKNLIAKGYITVRNIPSKRYAYYLTPKGFSEKSRLAYDLLHDYTRIYREAKNNLKQLFNEMSSKGIRKVVFAGSDEVAEIAYITLQETNLELIGIVDDEKTNDKFLGKDIRPLAAVKDMPYDSIVVTTYLKREPIYRSLLNMGLNKTDVEVIFPL